eukprot:Em0005g212a
MLSAEDLGWLSDVSAMAQNWGVANIEQPPSAKVTIPVALLAAFVAYYLLAVVKKPKVVGGNGELRALYEQHCPSLWESYWPTFWALNAHVSSIVRAFIQRHPPNISYERELVELADGGVASLDWVKEGNVLPPSAPVLLILAGMSGSSECAYIKHLALAGFSEDYRPVVFNQRGAGGVRMKTHRLFCCSKVDDLQTAIQHIRRRCPESKIIGVGVSLGGIQLIRYLHDTGDCSELSASIENSRVNIRYSHYLCGKVKTTLKSYLEQDGVSRRDLPFDVDKALRVTLMSEFDKVVTIPVFGYSCLDEYYTDATNSDKVVRIKRPLVCITATNDPFVPEDSLPYEAVENTMVTLVVTAYGGHIGFLEGILPTRQMLTDRVCKEFLLAMKQYHLKVA